MNLPVHRIALFPPRFHYFLIT